MVDKIFDLPKHSCGVAIESDSERKHYASGYRSAMHGDAVADQAKGTIPHGGMDSRQTVDEVSKRTEHRADTVAQSAGQGGRTY